MNECRTVVLSTGIRVKLDDNFVERLTLLSIKYRVLQPSFKNRPMERGHIMRFIANLLNLNASENDMDQILLWMRRVIYDKACCYTNEDEWFHMAPEWLCRAAAHLHLRPIEQLPQPAENLVISPSAARALMKHVYETQMHFQDPLLELVWDGVCESPMRRLDCLLKEGDRPNVSGVLTGLEWRIIDLVLLYSDENRHPVVTDESLNSVQNAALETTFELARAHRLDECAARSELARRWGRAYQEYTLKGFHTSLVVLQRRWYELRRRALMMRPGECRGCGLLVQVQEYAGAAPGPLYSWPDLVGGGMVFTYQEAIESEILNVTPKWKVDCVTAASRPANEGNNPTTTENIYNCNMKHRAKEGQIVRFVAKEAEMTESAKTKTGVLPAKTSRISSLLMFESDDEDLSPDESSLDPNSRTTSDVASEENTNSVAQATVMPDPEISPMKKPKLEIDYSMSTSFDTKTTLLGNASRPLDVSAPLAEIIVKSESEEMSPANIVKVEADHTESIDFDLHREDNLALPTSEVAPPSNHVTLKEEIDLKLLMDVKVILERINIQNYKVRRKRVPGSRKCMDIEEEQDSSRDSGDVWLPGGESESSSEETLRPVMLRDIDEVRRQAQRKLTAQVAPVTPAASTTSATSAAATDQLLAEESGTHGDQPATPLDDTVTDTVAPRMVVEVTQYCPLGSKSTRLRYGEAKSKRALLAAAVARRKRIRDKHAAVKDKKKLKDKKTRTIRKIPPDSSNESSKDSTEKSTDNVKDDMREWIRQRNLHTRYFSLGLAKDVSKRRQSNPTHGGDTAHRRKERAASLGKESPATTTVEQPSDPVPQMQPHISTVAIPSGPINAGTSAQSMAPVIRIQPASEELTCSVPFQTMQIQYCPQPTVTTPVTSGSTPTVLQLVLTNTPWITNQLHQAPITNGVAVPVNIMAVPLESKVGGEVTDDKSTAGDSTTVSRAVDSSENNNSPSINSTIVQETLGTPSAGLEATTDHPLAVLAPSTSASSPVIFGNSEAVAATEYIKHEDGSRLKVICKEPDMPFWIVDGEYLMLAEQPCDAVARRVSYYTLAPPDEIKRIIFDSYQTNSNTAGGRGEEAEVRVTSGPPCGGGGAGPAPARMCVQGKVYRKLCSTPLRYAQVLYAVRSVQHARRITRRGRAVLVYNARTRSLSPLRDHTHILRMHDIDINDQIIIDD